MSGISPMNNQAFTNAVSPFGSPEGYGYDSSAALRGEAYPGELPAASDTVHFSGQSHEEEPGIFGKMYNATTGFIANGIGLWGLMGAGIAAGASALKKTTLKGGVVLAGLGALALGNAAAFLSSKPAEAHGPEGHH